MKTLKHMWLAAAAANPRQTAIADERVERDYAQLLNRAARLADALGRAGVRPGDRVAMLAMNRAEWIEFYAACNIAGYIATTVNFRLAAPEVRAILADCEASVLIHEAQYAAMIDAIAPDLVTPPLRLCLSDESGGEDSYEPFLQSGDPAALLTAAIRPEDYAHLIYTSGTTGRPKGVLRTHGAEVSNGRSLALALEMRSDRALLLMMPLFHIGALAELHGQVMAHGTVVLQRKYVPADTARLIAARRIGATHMAPTMVQALLDEPGIADHDLSSLHTLCYAAAPMPVPLLKRGMALLGPIFIDCYGSTEMGATTVLAKPAHVLEGPDEQVARLGSVGQMLPQGEMRIVDEEGRPCPPGGVGEIMVRSDANFAAYWNNHAETLRVVRDGWFATGDMGYVDAEGYLFLVDRKKDMIVSGGENIYCREVEEALITHPAVSDVAVIGVPDEYWGEAVKAVVVPMPGARPTLDDLVAHCAQLIARYKRPRHVELVEQLPRLPSGKVSKVALRRDAGRG